MFRSGSIRKIQVKDFVTYSYTEFFPGPNLNMIIGPNGTGKSTMVAAIILGLGGNPRVVGRGTKVSEYVKHDCAAASIDIFLQGELHNEIIKITRQFDTSDRTVWFLNGRKVLLKQIQETISSFNIQVDNLCQFLPQDKVQDFAKMNKQELLRATQVALCRQELIEQQDRLIESRSRHKELLVRIDNKEKKLAEAQEVNATLEGRVQSFNNRKALLESIRHIDRKIAWLQYEQLYGRLEEVKRDKTDAQKSYDARKKAMKSKEDIIDQAKKRVSDIQKAESNVARTIREHETQLHDKLEDARKLKRSINRLEDETRIELQEIDTQEQEYQTLCGKLEEMKNAQNQLLLNYGSDEEFQQKKSTLQTEMNKISKGIRILEDQKEELFANKQEKNRQMASLQSEIARIENVAQQRLNLLQKTDRNAYEGVLWLRQNKHLFKDEVFEPIMLQVNVLDPKYAIFLENVIPLRDRIAFSCVNPDDMKLLIMKLRQEKKLVVNVLHASNSGSIHDFQPQIPIEQLKSLGFHCYLNSVFTCPDPIMKYLCRSYRLHNIPIGSDLTNKKYESVPQDIRIFFSDKFRFSVSFSKYSGAKSVTQNEINKDGTFSITLNVLQLDELKARIKDVRNSTSQQDNQLKSLDDKLLTCNQNLAVLKEEQKTYNTLKMQIETIGSRIKSLKERAKRLQGNKTDVESIRKKGERKIKKEMDGFEKIHKELQDLLNSYISYQGKLLLAGIKVQSARQFVSQLENESANARQAIQEAEEILNNIKNLYAEVLANAKVVLAKGKSLSDGLTPEDEGFSKFRTAYDKLSSDVAQLHVEKNRITSQIDCMKVADDAELQEYEDRQRQIEDYTDEIKGNNEDLNKVLTVMDQLQDDWLTGLREIVTQINRNFSAAFQRMNCAGEVDISVGDNVKDYAEYGLSIRVTYRSGEPLQELNRSVQSGGERAVATAAFMLALQDLTPVPFRCVDEINQGMDANNERRIFDLLVEYTAQHNTSQYFLITPKLVPNLKYGKNMMIHIIHNGPFVNPDTKWSRSKVCNPQAVSV